MSEPITVRAAMATITVSEAVPATESVPVTEAPTLVGDFLFKMRPFWWLYLSLLMLLALTLLYLKRGVLMDKCRRKDPRERLSRLDVTAFLGEVLVHQRPPPTYDQAMGQAPAPPTEPELPPKCSPEPPRKPNNNFNVWFA